MYCQLSCSDAHMLVEFNGDHIHHTDTPAALSKRDVAPKTCAKLLALFANGYGPGVYKFITLLWVCSKMLSLFQQMQKLTAFGGEHADDATRRIMRPRSQPSVQPDRRQGEIGIQWFGFIRISWFQLLAVHLGVIHNYQHQNSTLGGRYDFNNPNNKIALHHKQYYKKNHMMALAPPA